MLKITPSQSPEFCLAITEASYEQGIEKSNLLLKKQFPEAEVVDEATFRGWRIILIKSEDQLSVAFRGTDVWHNWAGNFYHEFFGDWPATTQQMERQINEWENRLGSKVTLFCAHSGAAIFCNAVRKIEEIARVMFNPHKACTGKGQINLATSNDELTIHCLGFSKDPHSEIKKYEILGPGGHSLSSFKQYLENKDWGEIAPNSSIIFENLQQQSLDTQAEPEATLLEPQDLGHLQEDLLAKQELLQKALDYSAFMENLSHASSTLASKIHHILIQEYKDKEHSDELKQKRNELFQHGDCLSEEIRCPSRISSSTALAQTLFSHFHPKQGIRFIEEIEHLTREYDTQIKQISTDLNSTEAVDLLLKTQLNQLNLLDEYQQHAYKKLVKTQQQIAKKLRKLEFICSSVSYISTITQ